MFLSTSVYNTEKPLVEQASQKKCKKPQKNKEQKTQTKPRLGDALTWRRNQKTEHC